MPTAMDKPNSTSVYSYLSRGSAPIGAPHHTTKPPKSLKISEKKSRRLHGSAQKIRVVKTSLSHRTLFIATKRSSSRTKATMISRSLAFFLLSCMALVVACYGAGSLFGEMNATNGVPEEGLRVSSTCLLLLFLCVN